MKNNLMYENKIRNAIDAFNIISKTYKSLARDILPNRCIGNERFSDVVEFFNSKGDYSSYAIYQMRYIESGFCVEESNDIAYDVYKCVKDIHNQENDIVFSSINSTAHKVYVDNLSNGINKSINMYNPMYIPRYLINSDVIFDNKSKIYYLMPYDPQAAEFVISEDINIKFIEDGNFCVISEWMCFEPHDITSVIKIIIN